MIPPVMLIFKQIPTTYEGNNCLLMDNPFLNLENSNFYSEIVGAVMDSINQSLASQSWRKKSVQKNVFVARMLEIHLFYLERN